jgi:hypothetical protein
MYFKLTEEQELIRDNMREFARTYVDPVAGGLVDQVNKLIWWCQAP